MIRAIGVLLIIAASATAFDLNEVKAEPDLEKRAKAALDYANRAITTSREAYTHNEFKKALASLDEVGQAAELCLASLDATGKSARKNPKPFKRAEMQINDLLRRLESLESDFGLDDRPAVSSVTKRLQEIHDALISRIMSKK